MSLSFWQTNFMKIEAFYCGIILEHKHRKNYICHEGAAEESAKKKKNFFFFSLYFSQFWIFFYSYLIYGTWHNNNLKWKVFRHQIYKALHIYQNNWAWKLGMSFSVEWHQYREKSLESANYREKNFRSASCRFAKGIWFSTIVILSLNYNLFIITWQNLCKELGRTQNIA